jgi:hypothetical protein
LRLLAALAGVLFGLGKFRDRPPCEPSRQSSARCTNIRTGVRPLLPRGEHRHCQILSPRLSGAFCIRRLDCRANGCWPTCGLTG